MAIQLIAINAHGASVTFTSETMAGAKAAFKSQYQSNGWQKIMYWDTETNTEIKKTYQARISGTRDSSYFDTANGYSLESAVAALKRKNKDWKDCTIWVCRLRENGQFENIGTYYHG